jgi:hypothetical protein
MNYPHNIAGSPVTITGYIDTAFHSTNDFYNFYDWRIATGCQSAAGSVQGIVENPITAAVTPGGPVSFCQGGSVTLTASPMGSYTYQWMKNNTPISGETGLNTLVSEPGSYSVEINSIACNDTSPFINVVVPCIYQSGPVSKP